VLKYVKWNVVAASLTVILICILVLGPFSYFAYLLTSELSSLVGADTNLKDLTKIVSNPNVKPYLHKVMQFIGTDYAQMQVSLAKSLSAFGKKLIEYIPGGISDIASAVVQFAFMVFALFFFLKDGSGLLARISEFMPFSKEHKERLITQVKDVVISTIYGGLVVALIQGLIGGTTFALLSIPSPILWGLAMSICAFIPIVGCTIIWVPAVFYLLVKGFFLKAIIMAVVGVFGISMADNVLRPIIMRGRLRMPLLVIFFSVLGGIQFFGLIGLIMGPLVLAIFVSVIDILRDIEKPEE